MRTIHGALPSGALWATESAPGGFVNAAGVLGVPASSPAHPDARSPCRYRHLRALASRIGETGQLPGGHLEPARNLLLGVVERKVDDRGRVHGEVETHCFDRTGLEVVGADKPDIGDALFETRRPARGGDVANLLAVARNGPASQQFRRLAGDAVDARAPAAETWDQSAS